MSCLLTFRLRHNYRIAETGNIPVRLGWRIITELLKEDHNSVCLLTFWLRHYYRIECWHILHLNLCWSNCIISYSESFQIMSDSHMWSMAMYMSSLTGRLDRPASPWRRGTYKAIYNGHYRDEQDHDDHLFYHSYKCMCSKHKDGFMIEVRKGSAAKPEVWAMQLIAPVFAHTC